MSWDGCTILESSSLRACVCVLNRGCSVNHFLVINSSKRMLRSNFPEVFFKLTVLLIMPQMIKISTVKVLKLLYENVYLYR